MKTTLDSRGFPACVGATHEQHAASNQTVELRTSLAMPSYPPPRLRILVLDDDNDCRGVLTSFRIFGYPGLAILCFLTAAAGGFWLVISILVQDHKGRKK